MAVTLGKRKRYDGVTRDVSPAKQGESDSDATAKALFQKAFEAKFKPLHVKPVDRSDEPEEEEDDNEDSELASDWDGLSVDSEEVEIVEHAQPDMDAIFGGVRPDKKLFMSSKPPALEQRTKPTRKTPKTAASTTEENNTESANLKNDLALQRLLKESRLLDPASFRSATGPEGKERIRALDMRMQDLGAKTSALQQEKMPLLHRKGIASKAANKEASRRKEAAENGVILEKARFQSNSQKRRERGIGGPVVGKMQGGTLKLSARDVRSIQGPPSSGTSRKGRRK